MRTVRWVKMKQVKQRSVTGSPGIATAQCVSSEAHMHCQRLERYWKKAAPRGGSIPTSHCHAIGLQAHKPAAEARSFQLQLYRLMPCAKTLPGRSLV